MKSKGKNYQRSIKPKCWLCGKINTIDKSLIKLIKKKEIILKSIKLVTKKKLQQTVQKYKESQETTMSNYMPIKLTTWEKRKNLEKLKLLRLNQEEIEIMDKSMTSNDEKSSNKQKPRVRWSHR